MRPRDLLSRIFSSRRYVMAMALVIINLLLIILLVAGLASCDNKALCYHHDHYVRIRVAFDWRDAPGAAPQGMTVYFYPEPDMRAEEGDGTGGFCRSFALDARDGGEIQLPKGRYRVIACNNDTELAFSRQTDNYDTHHLFTRDASVTELADGFLVRAQEPPRPAGSETEKVVAQPDNVWGCHALDVEVDESGVSYRCFPFAEKDDWKDLPPTVTEHVITLFPHDLVCHYSYEVRNVSNIGIVDNACAAITGMSATLHLGSERCGDEPATLPLEARPGGDGCIRGEFLTFGHPPNGRTSHRMGIYIWTRSGGSIFFGSDEERFDVTLQVDTASDRRRVHIIIDGLPLDTVNDGSNAGGGFQPGFGDWSEEHEDLII